MKKFVLVLLHGLGSDPSDMEALGQVLVEQQAESNIELICPQAPMRSVTLNHDMVMPAWYDIYQLDRLEPEDEEGIEASYDTLVEILDELVEEIGADRIILGGFSQGAAIALYTALRYPKALAGVMAISTYLPRLESTVKEATQSNLNMIQVHGGHDEILPIVFALSTYSVLLETGQNIKWYQHEGAHEVNDEAVSKLSLWLSQIVNGIL